MTQELYNLIRESFEYNMSNVHTSFPGVVKKYDNEKRRATIQPCLNRKLPSGDFIQMPVITDVPIVYPGCITSGIHFNLQDGDEVLCVISERSIDTWKDNDGGIDVSDKDPRRFNLIDCVAIPGLQASTFPGTGTEGFNLYDDAQISIQNEKSIIELKDDKVEISNDTQTLGGILVALMDALASLATEGSPAMHTATVWANQYINTPETGLKARVQKLLKE